MRFRVRYRRPAELVTDHDQQFARGGLLVRTEPPAELLLYDAVELEIVPPGGEPVVLAGQVVQLLPGVGVAIGFPPQAAAALGPAVEAARQAGDRGGLPAEHGLAHDEPVDAFQRIKQASTNEKIQMALHGGRDERQLVLRDINKALHKFVLQNPHIGLDEVLGIAKMPTVTADVLALIADKREWAQRPDIAVALVRNPKTPVPVAIKLLDFVALAEVRRLAKDTATRLAIRQAAMRRLDGGR